MGLIGKIKSTFVDDSIGPTEEKSFEFGIDLSRFTKNKKFAGVTVNEYSSLELTTVFACIRDKSESISQLPVKLKYRGKIVKDGHDRLRKIFTKKPCDFMSMQDLVSNYVTCLESYGRWMALAVRNKYGNVSEIVPFRYQRNITVNMDAFGRVYYHYVTNDGKPVTSFSQSDIIHIKLNTLDGFTGLSPISAGARTIGVAISEEEYIGNLMENGAVAKGVLTMDTFFKDPNAIARIKQEWQEQYGGSKNAGKTPILEGGMTYNAVGINPADAELIKQRIFSAHQLCALFRVPPERVHLNIEGKGTKRTVEENNTEYMRSGLMPLITKFEFAMSELVPAGYEVIIDEKHFVRGDRKSQVEATGKEFSLGGISINEMREDLGRDEIDGGDVHAIDTNNLTFGPITDIPKLQEQIRQANTAKPKPKEQEVEEDVE